MVLFFGRTGRGLHVVHDGRCAALASKDRQGNRGHHEDDGAPCGEPGKHRSRAARAKGRLAARAAKHPGNISTLAVLQEHHNNQDRAYDHVNYGYENSQH